MSALCWIPLRTSISAGFAFSSGAYRVPTELTLPIGYPPGLTPGSHGADPVPFKVSTTSDKTSVLCPTVNALCARALLDIRVAELGTRGRRSQPRLQHQLASTRSSPSRVMNPLLPSFVHSVRATSGRDISRCVDRHSHNHGSAH